MVWRVVLLWCVVVGMGCQAWRGEVVEVKRDGVGGEALREQMRSRGNIPQTVEAQRALVDRWLGSVRDGVVPWRAVLREPGGCEERERYAGVFGAVRLDAAAIVCEEASMSQLVACERAYLELASRAILAEFGEQERLNAAQHAYMLERFGGWTREVSAWRVTTSAESFYVSVRYYDEGVEVDRVRGVKGAAPVMMAYQCHLPHGEIFSLEFL